MFTLDWLTMLPSSGAQKAAKIDSGDAIAQRVNVEVDNVHASLLGVNVTLMFAGTVGLGKHFP